MPKHYILMGDIIGSSKYDATKLREQFIHLIHNCNKELEPEILSPYTVTLGDEFQGIASSLLMIIKSIFYLEETGFKNELSFKIRDVKTIFKGILERLLLYIALINGYPQILIALGAMKLGTRLHDEKDSEISNTYFLFGNILSMLLAIIGSVVTKLLWLR